MVEPIPVIKTRGLTRYYGETVGVEDLDLEVLPGEIFGFLGPNGAGKTTTIRLLLDLIHPTSGEAFLFGRPANTLHVRARVGYLPGELALDTRMSGHQTLRFLASLEGHGGDETSGLNRDRLCSRLGLAEGDLRRRIREYSRGMKQKLGLVAAFQHAPGLLILDEPTTGLDPLVREVVFQLMDEAREGGATVFHSSHVLTEVDRSCDRVAVLRDGKLVTTLTVQEARDAATRRMMVEFQAEPPLESLTKVGAILEKRFGNRVELRVPGEIQPILSILAANPVLYMSFPEPSLEDAFAAFYRGEPVPDAEALHAPRAQVDSRATT